MESLPSADAVLAHGFDFRPNWWHGRAPTSWTAFLNELPEAAAGRGYRHITRQDLLSHATDLAVNDGGLLVACYVWGTGTSGWLVPRRSRVFRDTAADTLRAQLAAARQVLDHDGPAAAYASMSDGGTNRIKHMRASFFTKFLYAASAPRLGEDSSALILDQFVAIALNDLHDWGIAEKGPWSVQTYARWLKHAASEAAAASTVDQPVRVDAVEMAYFRHGRYIARERRAGAR